MLCENTMCLWTSLFHCTPSNSYNMQKSSTGLSQACSGWSWEWNENDGPSKCKKTKTACDIFFSSIYADHVSVYLQSDTHWFTLITSFTLIIHVFQCNIHKLTFQDSSVSGPAAGRHRGARISNTVWRVDQTVQSLPSLFSKLHTITCEQQQHICGDGMAAENVLAHNRKLLFSSVIIHQKNKRNILQ